MGSIAVYCGIGMVGLIGLLILWPGCRNLWRAMMSPGWPTTEGTVVRSGMSGETSTGKHGDRSTMYSAEIVVRYQVGGRSYSTETLHFGQTLGSGDASDAELRHLRYPAGARIRVSYDPADPSVGAVKAGFDREVLWLPGAGLAFLLPAIMFAVLYRSLEHDSMLGMGLGVFAVIFCLIGLALLVPGLTNLWRAHTSLRWPVAPGTVVFALRDSSDSVTEDSEGNEVVSTSESARLVYRYEVAGQRHFANVRVFGQLSGASADWADDIADRYPKGKTVSVAYHPQDPDLAVLEPGIDPEAYWLPGAGAAFLFFGIAVFVWGIPALTRQ